MTAQHWFLKRVEEWERGRQGRMGESSRGWAAAGGTVPAQHILTPPDYCQ